MSRVGPGCIVRPIKDDLSTYREPRLGMDTVQRDLPKDAIILVICRLPEVRGRSMGENGTWCLVLTDDTLGWVPIVWLEDWWATEGYRSVDPDNDSDMMNWQAYKVATDVL